MPRKRKISGSQEKPSWTTEKPWIEHHLCVNAEFIIWVLWLSLFSTAKQKEGRQPPLPLPLLGDQSLTKHPGRPLPCLLAKQLSLISCDYFLLVPHWFLMHNQDVTLEMLIHPCPLPPMLPHLKAFLQVGAPLACVRLAVGRPSLSFAHPGLWLGSVDSFLWRQDHFPRTFCLLLLLKDEVTHSLIQTRFSAGSFSLSWKCEKKGVKFPAVNQSPGAPESLEACNTISFSEFLKVSFLSHGSTLILKNDSDS